MKITVTHTQLVRQNIKFQMDSTDMRTFDEILQQQIAVHGWDEEVELEHKTEVKA